MKAQLSIEYYVSLIIFILFVSYLFFQLITLSPQFNRELENERLRSESYQISELLVNDPGEPIDWPIKTVKRLGLSSNLNKTNLLSEAKISAFQLKCDSDYEDVKKLIGTEYYFSINLTNIDSNEKLIECGPPIPVIKQMKVSMTRIVALDSNNVCNLTLQLW